jgi:hypothetical protein
MATGDKSSAYAPPEEPAVLPSASPPSAPREEPAPVADPDRERARKHLDDRRGLWSHVFVYLVINAFLVGAWFVTGAGYFWPGWVLGGWGVAVVLHGWDFYWRWRRPITEADVDAEVRRAHKR